MDLSKLSDEELDKLDRAQSMDLSKLSDEELDKLEEDPGYLESLGRGALQGASLGFSDEITGAVEGALTEKTYEQARDEARANNKRAKEANPKTYLGGEIGGGVGTLFVPGLGAVNAAKTARGAMAVGAGFGAATGLGNSEAKDAQGMAVDTLTGLGLGGATGGLGYGASKLLQGGANVATQRAAPLLSKMLPVGKKENAAAIEAAMERLGAKATPGMTNASESVQKLESSLHQAPTIGGWLTRRGTKPVTKAMQNTTDDLISDASTVSPWESGEKTKKILSSEIEKRFKPSTDAFNELRESTKHIPVNEKSRERVAKNILKIPEVETFDINAAKQAAKALEKSGTADQIKQLRTMVGKKAKSATDSADRSALWQVYAKLGRLEENSIKRGAIETARELQPDRKGGKFLSEAAQGKAADKEGNVVAAQMLKQLKDAKAGYSKEMTALEDFSQSARMGRVNSPDDFVSSIENVPSERLQEKLLPLEDARLAQKVQTQFPEAFNTLKGARLRDLSEGVVQDGEALPGKLIQRTKGLNPEAQDMLFGAKASKLDDLRTVHQALPDKVGPSGTQQALDVAGMLNPMNQVRDLARYGTYKAVSSEKLASIAKFLRSRPQFASMAEKNPRAFQAAVVDISKRINPGDMGEKFNRVAGPGDQPVDEESAQQSFLEGN